MLVTTTAKIKLILSRKQRGLLDDTMLAYRAACNYVSAYVFRTGVKDRSSLNKALYHDIRGRFGLRSQMAQSVLNTVIARYKVISKDGERTYQGPLCVQGDGKIFRQGRISIRDCETRLQTR